jgi:hypothetical protein
VTYGEFRSDSAHRKANLDRAAVVIPANQALTGAIIKEVHSYRSRFVAGARVIGGVTYGSEDMWRAVY